MIKQIYNITTLFIMGIYTVAFVSHNVYCKNILIHHDETTIRNIILDEIPSFTINSLELITAGWDNVVAEVNNEWIFRFTRDKASIPTLEHERLLLDHLRQHISLPIPHYTLFGTNTAFVGYRKINGETILDTTLYLALDDTTQQEIANSLALFLTQLHHAITVDEALKLGYKKKHEVPLELIKNSIVGTLQSTQAERLIQQALTYVESPIEEHFVVLHNDLHGGNFTLDPNTYKVMGVFDFSDAAIGNIFIDFVQLFNIHYDLVMRTIKRYTELNNISLCITRVAAEYILRRAQFIVHAREQNNETREKQLIQQLEKFAATWDSL